VIVALLLASAPLTAEPPHLATAKRDVCSSSDPKEIVVCGSREHDSRYRLPKLSQKYERGAFRADAELAPGLHARAHVDSVELPGGAKSNRVLLSIGLGF
jgi:hypothetical protein